MNFSRDVVDAAVRGGSRSSSSRATGRAREWTFGEVADRSARLAGASAANGIGRGDVVMTLIGNRPEWVFTMVACLRIGAVALPCTEQLRAKDLALRLEVARPKVDPRRRAQPRAARRGAAGLPRPLVPDDGSTTAAPAPPADLGDEDPALLTFGRIVPGGALGAAGRGAS